MIFLCPSIQRILVRMTKAHVTVNDWKSLYASTYNGILVGDLCRSLPQNIPIFKRVSTCVDTPPSQQDRPTREGAWQEMTFVHPHRVEMGWGRI